MYTKPPKFDDDYWMDCEVHSFVDREEELDFLQRNLLNTSIQFVWIFGSAGFGKVSLAKMFAHIYQESFPGGVYCLNPELREETLLETIHQAYLVASSKSLIIIEHIPFYYLGKKKSEEYQELRNIGKRCPETKFILTSIDAPPPELFECQIELHGITLETFRHFAQLEQERTGEITLTDDLYLACKGNIGTASMLSSLIWNRTITPHDFLDSYHPFTFPGIVDPQGDEIPIKTPEHHHVITDVVNVSDEFLQYLNNNPRMMYELNSRGFEELVAELLHRLDYEVILTPASKDGGKDIYAAKKDQLGTFLYIVECKKYAPNRRVGVGLIRQLHGVVQAEQATAGILATTSFFTKGAKEFQKTISSQISLKDYIGIHGWLQEVFTNKISK
jgi:restriction system protein